MRSAGALSIAVPWLLTLGLFVAVVVTGLGATSIDFLDLPTLAFLLATASWGLVQATVGALIAVRRPENRIGRLLQVSGPLIVAVFLGYTLAAGKGPTLDPGDPVGTIAGWWASTTIFLAIYLAFPLVGILYPDGRLPSLRWRLPILTLTLVEIAVAIVYATKAGPLAPGLPDNPFGLVAISAEASDSVGLVATLALVLAMTFAITAIAVRWRRGNRVERSQLKWLLAALVVAGTMFPITFGSSSSDEPPSILATMSVGSALLIPIAIGIAIFRYRLYEIDRLVSRTVSWAVVTGVLAAVFIGVVVALQALLEGFTQGQTLAVAGSTLAAFALFQPLRRRVQSAVDRRFDRARYDAQHTVDAFAEGLRNEVDLARLRTALVTTADDAVRPVSTTVWLRGGPEAST